ncbi:MAG TPA: hypothetical protein VJ785_08640 [Anaerolineales bacterium]|nr:hypothetical protein [Anaerolineales bacterium]
MNAQPVRSLDEQRLEFSQSRFLAMPIAGMIAWTIIGISGVFVPVGLAAWILFICTGMIFMLGLLIARFTGEDLLGKTRNRNEFDQLFFQSVLMSWLVFAIAIPFFMTDPTSLPLSVGILAGLMWLPLSWIIKHWVGSFHTFTRTALVTLAWFVLPEQRYVVIPAIIVVIYLITIYVLANRQLPTQEASFQT